MGKASLCACLFIHITHSTIQPTTHPAVLHPSIRPPIHHKFTLAISTSPRPHPPPLTPPPHLLTLTLTLTLTLQALFDSFTAFGGFYVGTLASQAEPFPFRIGLEAVGYFFGALRRQCLQQALPVPPYMRVRVCACTCVCESALGAPMHSVSTRTGRLASPHLTFDGPALTALHASSFFRSCLWPQACTTPFRCWPS